MIRTMLVDDQILFLESLKIVLENQADDIQVIGTAHDGREAVEKAAELKPDLILMDVRMPEMDGVAAARIIRKEQPEIHIIMLTTFEDDEFVKAALHCGAAGYMLKNIDPLMLINALRAVHSGAVLISPDIALSLVDDSSQSETAAAANPSAPQSSEKEEIPDWYISLSPREKAILKYLIQGMTNKEIAREVHLGDQTTRNYMSSIYSKMDVVDRLSAIRKARTLASYFFH